MQTTHGGPATFPKSTSPDIKRAARQLYRDQRQGFIASLDKKQREALEQNLSRICLPLASQPGPWASYAAVGPEIDPVFIEQSVGPHAFPLVSGRNLSFHLADWKDLVPGTLSIPEPLASAPQVTPRMLLVPLIAATQAGTRLGQGGGFYDRTLARLRAAGPCIAIGLGWDCQIAEALPALPHDQPLDWLATPTRLFECARYR